MLFNCNSFTLVANKYLLTYLVGKHKSGPRECPRLNLIRAEGISSVISGPRECPRLMVV